MFALLEQPSAVLLLEPPAYPVGNPSSDEGAQEQEGADPNQERQEVHIVWVVLVDETALAQRCKGLRCPGGRCTVGVWRHPQEGEYGKRQDSIFVSMQDTPARRTGTRFRSHARRRRRVCSRVPHREHFH